MSPRAPKRSLLARLERRLTSVFGPAQLGDPREPPPRRPGEPAVPGEWERKGPPGARYLVRREQPAPAAPEVSARPEPRLIPHEDVERPAITQGTDGTEPRPPR